MSSQKWRCSWKVLTGNVPSTSECSTILLPKVWLILVVWWQGKNRSSIFKLIFGMIKKHTFPSFSPLISFHPLGKYIQDGTTLQETSYDVWCMYYISTDLCTFMAFPQHHLPHINLGGIISFSVMLGVCLVITQSWANPLEVPEVLSVGSRGPKSCLGSYICSQTFGRFLH